MNIESNDMQGDERVSGPHLTAESAAALASGGRDVTPARRAELEAHLVTCGECRSEVAMVVRVLRAERQPRRLRFGAVAIAAAVLLVFIARPGSRPSDGESPLRATGDAAAVLEVVSPSAVTASAVEARTFAWRSAGSGARYEFRITRDDGAPLWSSGTADTSINLPAEVRLESNKNYLWFVDALLSDGRTLSSGLRQLHTPP